MTIQNPPKAFLVLVAMVCITVLMATHTIDQSAGTGLLGSMIGYAVGNGIAARGGKPVEPILGRKDQS